MIVESYRLDAITTHLERIEYGPDGSMRGWFFGEERFIGPSVMVEGVRTTYDQESRVFTKDTIVTGCDAVDFYRRAQSMQRELLVNGTDAREMVALGLLAEFIASGREPAVKEVIRDYY